MKPGILAALALLPGGLIVLALIWWRRRWLERERRAIAARIVPPIQRFEKAMNGEDEAMRAGAERRRHAADDKRRDAARIQSGQPVEERLRLVK